MSDVCAGDLSKDNYSFQKVVAVLGVTLMTIKFIAWYVTSSVSILTDALESIVNVVAAFVGLYALYLSSKPRDLDHPYGHGKVELISSSVEGVMILVAGLMIITQAISRLIYPEPVGSLDLGLILVAITAIANYSVGRIAISKGRRNRSMALVASGKHLCSDTYSSVGIIVGLCLMIAFDAMGFDFWWLDPAIAMLFGAIILVTGVKVVKDSFDGVMDRMDEQTVNESVRAIREADCLLVVGTSLTVYPAAGFVRYFRGKHFVLINRDETPMDDLAELVLRENAGKIFAELRL